MIFDEDTLRKVTRLVLVAGRVRAGALQGERRSTRRGSGTEFADYRSYAPGDDLRRLDWNAYARLDRPFLKLFEEEQDLAVTLLIDASASMDWGTGQAHKLRYALRLAGALGAIALANGDRLLAASLRGGRSQPAGAWRGSQSTLPFLQALERLEPGGETDLAAALGSFARQRPRPGLAFLISDLLSPGGFQDGLRLLQAQGFEVSLLHLLAPDELDPPLSGDLHLVDNETGQGQDVSLNSGLLLLYRQRIAAWQSEIQAGCRQRGIRYLAAGTGVPWERLVLQEMRRSGMVK